MATNFHTDLPNDQLHVPKDFATARDSSVLTRSDSGNLEWNASPYDVETVITCGADVAGGLHNRSFFVYYDASLKAQLYLKVAGDSTPIVPVVGYDLEEVDIAANDTAITIAAAIETTLNRMTAGPKSYNFTVSLNGSGKITFSGMSNAPNTTDNDTGFAILNVITHTGTTVLTSTNGVLSWQAGGGGSVTSVTATAPITSSGGTTPNIAMVAASGSNDGYLRAADWLTFNNKTNTHSEKVEGWCAGGTHNDFYVQNKEINNNLNFSNTVGPSLSGAAFLEVLQAGCYTGINGEIVNGFSGVISGNGGVQVELSINSQAVDCAANNPAGPIQTLGVQSFTLLGNDRPMCIAINANSYALSNNEVIFAAIRYPDDRDIGRFRFVGRLEITKS